MLHRALALAVFASAVTAQTFVVDIAGGPGANFTNLQTAIDTVPDGAVLLIRPGNYPYVQITGKGLSLLATAPGVNLGALFADPIVVQNLRATQALTLRGLRILYGGGQAMIDVHQCAGPVLIDDFDFDRTVNGTSNLFPIGIAIDTCAQVTVRNSRILAYEAISAFYSSVVIENCELIGQDAFDAGHASIIAGTAVSTGSSDVTFARCQVRGGNGWSTSSGTVVAPPSAAIRSFGARIRICDDGNGSYTAGLLPAGTPTPAVDGPSGTVVRDPSPVLAGSNGGGAVGAGIVDIVRPLPSLRTVSAPPGGTVHADVTTPLGELVLLAVALPGPVLAVPGVDGTFWLDPGTAFLATFGIPQPGAPVQHSIAVPSGPALVGARFAWQAVAYSAADGLRASNPSTYAH